MVGALIFSVTGWDNETCTEYGKVHLDGEGI
jgi:hypothetical protein